MPIKNIVWIFSILVFYISFFFSCKKETDSSKDPGLFQLVYVKIGNISLDASALKKDLPIDGTLEISFNNPLDTASSKLTVDLKNSDNTIVPCKYLFSTDHKTLQLKPITQLTYFTNYTLNISKDIKGAQGETFPGISYSFSTINGTMTVSSITLNGTDFSGTGSLQNIPLKNNTIEIGFSQSLKASDYQSYFNLSGNTSSTLSLSSDGKKVTFTPSGNLAGYTKYTFSVSSDLKASNGFNFGGYSRSFYTTLDSTYKFPLISDDELLTLVQKQTFRYFWDLAHPSCGLARERNSSGDVVTIGGSGFGVMAIIVAMERGFITRSEGLTRMDKILSFLETCDRFHGAWPHWLNGSTGKTVPFSPKDDGGDLVETSFMMQGLIALRQYLQASVPSEKSLIDRINALANTVEYDWFTQNQNVLYWHWSPNTGWLTNLKLEGYNETLITYVMAASSNTHTIPADAYKIGYTKNGSIVNGQTYYGYKLPLGEAYGGPLFFTHYSFLGLDPRKLKDGFANYWEQNVNQSLINWAYCSANPKHFAGYSQNSWGLTASDNPWGYNAHSPGNDLGVITPTAAISSIPYTPTQSLNAIKNFYYLLGNKLWGNYGFYDAFDVSEGWWADSYLAIDQGPIICMIENYRTALLWNLFMSAPEIKSGLDKLGFTY